MKHILRLALVLLLGLLASVQTRAQNLPVIVSTRGYINGNVMTAHTATAFNSVGASTLVAFVSTNTPWNGLPVSISGLSDNAGNTWNVLTGPTTWAGSSSTLVSAIYYVNAPITSATETVTVNLSNPAPLVFHIFAVSGADITGPPISSVITNPGVGGTSAVVTTAPIAVPTDSLLLSWVKNETSATATAVAPYTLDAQQSTSFLWAESQAPISAGSYSGQFQYSSAIGWQTAIVGLKPLTGPEAASQAVTTKFNTPVNITLTGISPQGFPLTYSVVTGPSVGTLSGTPPNLTYTPATGYIGHDSFTFKANDGTTNSNTATVSITVQGSVDVVSTTGYINGTPQSTHTSATFNTIGSSTLVAFVSSHPSWNGLPVSISGLSDSAGNTWSVLTGPTQFSGSQFTLLSTVYYVNAPSTLSNETVTVSLTNPAPLVLHVFAVSGADTTGPPIPSAITSPAAGGTSASVTTAPIAVPTDSLLLSWAKNETSATATALGGYTLDTQQSTSFLWAEFETAFSASTYTGQFHYDSAIGWQTAIVGLKPPGSVVQPVLTSTPANPTSQTSASFSFTDTQTGVSFLCQLDGSAFSACTSPASYSGLVQGSHTLSVIAQDASNNQSAAASFTWTISAPPPPAPTITSTPANPTSQTSASFSFTDTQAGVSFLCQLDGSAFSACTNPASYSSLVQGSHTFSVEAQDTAGNQSAAAGFTWTISTTAPPMPTITSKPANPTNQISASFSFTDTEVGVSFLCQLDGRAFSACTSPASYSGLSLASHTFSVKAQDTAGNQSAAVNFTWTIQAVVTPVIVSTQGYINGTPLTAHTATAFNSVGASTLVAFVSTNTPWNGLPVSISGLSDNAGNTWNVLTGPTTWAGSSSTLVSAIYYVNAPITSATETVTVNLSNPAPLVFHIFAVSGADITGPPISSVITNPGGGGTSAVVTTAPIAVPTDSLLLSWVKNETSATATAVAPYTLDAQQSTSFLWAESQAPISAGSYSGQFQYSSAIGWQTAIVGLKPLTGPEAASQAVTTKFNTPVNITLTGISPQGFPLTYSVVTGPSVGTLSGTPPNLTYTPATGYIGHDSFTFKANDGTTNSNTATVSITVQGSVDVVSTTGYINGTPQSTHTSATFNTIGSSTLVAFVSSHPSWNGLPVSISGLSDSAGNTWSVLTGPTQFSGSQFTLLSTVYYVNAPSTLSNETVTVSLTNPAPLVLHVFAVSGADTTGPPIPSAITSPAAGGTSASVTTAPIAVPTDSLLLSWAKNETSATATALGGYTLDTQQSTSFLWAEFKAALIASTYTGQFQYDSAIGWQTAIVGLKPPGSVVQPVLTSTPANPTSQTSASFSFTDTQTGVSFLCQLDGSAFSACTSPASYSGLVQGSHTLSVIAQDASNNQSATASFTWTITTPPPAPTITSTPTNPTNQTSASFSFTDTQAGVSFFCQLDGSAFSACTNPASYSGLVQGSHTFSVEAQDTAGNQSGAAGFTWTISTTAPPIPTITSKPANPTNQISASFSFTDTEVGVSFLCQLDGRAFSACTSPASYSGLSLASHTFSVKAQDTAGNQSAAASFTWNIESVLIAFDQVAAATPQSATATVTVTFPGAQSAGDLNIVVVGWNDTTSSVQSVNDSAGNTYNLAIGPTSGTALQQSIYYAANIVGGSNTVTVTFNQAAAFPDVRILEYRGVTTLDATAGASGNSTAANSGAATTRSAYELIFGADTVFTTTAAAGSGFTSRIITGDGDIAEDKIATTAGSNSATAKLGSAAPWVMQMVTFSFSPGPAPTVSGVSPNAGPTAGGTAVTINGTNFVTGATVTFGGAPATNVQVVLGTQITATTPAGSAGAATVTVSSPGGQNGTLSSGFTYLAPPTVSTVFPNDGPIAGGTPVTIAGTNFVAGATVNFGANAATNVVVVSATQITATTPAGTAGTVAVKVTNSSGLSGSLTNGFTYGPPTVSNISPNNGPAAGGTAVIITGTRFTTGATVTFGTAAATNVVVVSATKITATTPASAAGAVNVTVTDAGGQSGSLTNGFIYGPATVSSVSPNNGPVAGGTVVTITGTSFATGATLTFGGTAATNVVVASTTKITATTPAGTAGSVTVTVTSTGGLSGSLNNGFIYGPPAVSIVSPNTGSTAGGTPVTISGTNFATGSTVTFGTAAATNVVVVSATQITATTPAGAAGTITVTVTDSGGQSGQSGGLANGFTYAVGPTVSSVFPNNGSTAGGTAVTITGTNFATGSTVTFGAAAATNVTVVSATQITATTPAGTAGAVTVTVTHTGNLSGSLNSGFTYGSPAVSTVSPNTGSIAGGTLVTITGMNFFAGATVTFGSTAATNVVVVSATKITANTPAGAAGAVSVTVTDSGAQSGSLTNGFTYAVVPTISSVSPNSGPTAGGTAVTITGTNFGTGATVAFGATAATNVTVVSATKITATTQVATAGAVTVTVTIPGGQTGSLSNGFTYLPPLTIALGQLAAATPQSPTVTVSVSFPAAQSVGDLNIVVVGWNDTTSSVQSVNDSTGNTYNLAIGPTSGTALQQSIYYAANIVGASNTVTVTFNQAAAFPDVRILEYRGVTTLDATAGASGNSTAANSGAATTRSAYELIFGADTVFTTTRAAGSGFTSRIITGDGDIAEDKTATTAGSNSATATLSSAGPWIMQMVTFK